MKKMSNHRIITTEKLLEKHQSLVPSVHRWGLGALEKGVGGGGGG